MLEGALLLLAGLLLGRFLPARRKGPKAARQPEPVCGCSHHHAYHDPETGACGYGQRLITYRDAYTTKYGDTAGCPCLQYSGPVPMPEYFAPEITGGSGG